MSRVCSVTDTPVGIVETIQNARNTPMRSLIKGEQAKDGLTAFIARIAEQYCGADITLSSNKGVFKMCGATALNHFGGFAQQEIELAFSLASVGSITADIRAYNGKFTVAAFSQCLTAYRTYRERVVKGIEAALDADRLAEQDKENRKKNEATIKQVYVDFARLQKNNSEIKVWQSVPMNWAKILSQAGLIETDRELWVEVKGAVKSEFVRECSGGNYPTLLTQNQCKRILNQIKNDSDYFPIELKHRAEVVYGKRLVFKHLASFTN